MKRIITYDLRNGDQSDYQDLYDVLKKLNGIRLTESSYVINTSLEMKDIIEMIRNVIYSDDIVYYVSVNTKGNIFYVKI